MVEFCWAQDPFFAGSWQSFYLLPADLVEVLVHHVSYPVGPHLPLQVTTCGTFWSHTHLFLPRVSLTKHVHKSSTTFTLYLVTWTSLPSTFLHLITSSPSGVPRANQDVIGVILGSIYTVVLMLKVLFHLNPPPPPPAAPSLSPASANPPAVRLTSI